MKIINFQINPSIKNILDNLKEKGVEKIDEEIKQLTIDKLKYVKENVIKPAVVFKNISKCELDSLNDQNLIEATVIAATIGEKIEEEISYADEQEKKILDAIARECLNSIPNLIHEILLEQTKYENYVLSEPIQLSNDILPKMLKIVEAEKVNIELKNSKLYPNYSIVVLIKWFRKKKEKKIRG